MLIAVSSAQHFYPVCRLAGITSACISARTAHLGKQGGVGQQLTGGHPQRLQQRRKGGVGGREHGGDGGDAAELSRQPGGLSQQTSRFRGCRGSEMLRDEKER